MRSQVTVTWGEPSTYRFDLEGTVPMSVEEARRWLDQQFTRFECEPIRLTGKVLTADKVLAVAQAAGETAFRDEAQRDWAVDFARASSAALAKPLVSVDLATLSLAY
jgi:hypothetical protein